MGVILKMIDLKKKKERKINYIPVYNEILQFSNYRAPGIKLMHEDRTQHETVYLVRRCAQNCVS